MDEKYIGVIVRYKRIAFAPEENADGTRQFIFDYDVVFDPGNEDLTTKEFVDHLGDLAIELLDEQLKNGNAIFK